MYVFAVRLVLISLCHLQTAYFTFLCAHVQVVLPSTVPASMAYLNPDGCYLVDNGQVLVLWIGRDASPAWLTQVSLFVFVVRYTCRQVSATQPGIACGHSPGKVQCSSTCVLV